MQHVYFIIKFQLITAVNTILLILSAFNDTVLALRKHVIKKIHDIDRHVISSVWHKAADFAEFIVSAKRRNETSQQCTFDNSVHSYVRCTLVPTCPSTNRKYGMWIQKRVESVQRAFTKKLPDMNSLTHRERLSVLRLESLELRRLKADLIVFWNFKGFHQHWS